MRRALVIAALLVGACSRPATHALPPEQAKKVLLDRNWLDRVPQKIDDKLHVYRFVPSMGGGVFQDRTLYKGTFELFRFQTKGDEIHFDLPETHQEVTSRFRIEAVDGPAPFDLKLTIDADPRGSQVYYGMRSETDRDGHLLDRDLQQHLHSK
jgi:hypothetical protein